MIVVILSKANFFIVMDFVVVTIIS